MTNCLTLSNEVANRVTVLKVGFFDHSTAFAVSVGNKICRLVC
jgi:hypothetical protein